MLIDQCDILGGKMYLNIPIHFYAMLNYTTGGKRTTMLEKGISFSVLFRELNLWKIFNKN